MLEETIRCAREARSRPLACTISQALQPTDFAELVLCSRRPQSCPQNQGAWMQNSQNLTELVTVSAVDMQFRPLRQVPNAGCTEAFLPSHRAQRNIIDVLGVRALRTKRTIESGPYTISSYNPSKAYGPCKPFSDHLVLQEVEGSANSFAM